MNTENIVWTVTEQKISNIHTASPILTPGNWVDNDPFLLLLNNTPRTIFYKIALP